MRTLRRLASIRVPFFVNALLAVVGLGLFLRWFEQANLYFPVRGVDATPRVLGLAFEAAEFPAADGTALRGWFVPGPRPDAPVALFLHGNGGNIGHRLDKLVLLRRAGLAVLLFDYRGYGASAGRPSERGLYSDAEGAYRYLVETRQVPAARIVLHGESLGGAVATELASRREVGAVILESTFTSVVDMGRKVFPLLPVAWIVRQRYDALSKVGRLRAPLLVLHSPQDDIVPFEQGRRLFEAAPPPKAFVELRGDHNEGFLESGELYPNAIRDFLEKAGLRAKG